ncbi:hypothetical protein GUJ93_ZPchr0006g42261 [Zizania palustris]|nr:hypothetical protein GUJ93_ZPchr0006g42261 [Zizania palustris]
MRMKRCDTEQWMAHRLLPDNLTERIGRCHDFKLLWKSFCISKGKSFWLVHDQFTYVPMFENMDDQLLDAMCDRLKPMLYTEASCIIRKGDLARDFCGEELLTWALDPTSASNLPSSTRTVKTLSEVEAFALRV